MDYLKYIYSRCYQFKWITLFVSLPTQVFARMKSQSQRSLSRIKTSRNTSAKVWFTRCLILSQNILTSRFFIITTQETFTCSNSSRNIRKRCEMFKVQWYVQSHWCRSGVPWLTLTYFTHFPSISIVDFKQVNVW